MTSYAGIFDWTADEIEAGIAKAIGDRDLWVVPGLIRLLARQDPRRAQAVLDTIEIAREIRSER